MQNQEADRRDDVQYILRVSTAHEYREALSRIRILDGAKPASHEGREREALELAVSRYLMSAENQKH
jgi:hypothetical protein